MKKLLLLVLILALCAAAFFAKPQDPKASLTTYLTDHPEKLDGVFPAIWAGPKASWFAGQCEYKDKVLWTDVKFHDHTIYTNVFSRWINRAELKETAREDIQKARREMDKAADKITGDKPA